MQRTSPKAQPGDPLAGPCQIRDRDFLKGRPMTMASEAGERAGEGAVMDASEEGVSSVTSAAGRSR